MALHQKHLCILLSVTDTSVSVSWHSTLLEFLGTSDNGNASTKIFSQKWRPDVLKLLFANANPQEIQAIDKVMSYYSVISKVTNSTRKMTPERISKFEAYCKEAYLYRRKSIDYWPMNKSIHRLWCHSAQKMRQLGFSLGIISENALERMVMIFLIMKSNSISKPTWILDIKFLLDNTYGLP